MKVDLLQRGSGDPQKQQALQEIGELLIDSVNAARSLAVELSPPILHARGLIAAIEWLARWMKEKHGLTVRLDVDEKAEPATEELRVTLFETARELLFNVVKHAGSNEARLHVGRLAADRIRIEVSDSGVGFDAAGWKAESGSSNGLGLAALQHRLELLGGALELESAVGQGTTVRATVPARLPE
jgi:signal transduction histidine kinase